MGKSLLDYPFFSAPATQFHFTFDPRCVGFPHIGNSPRIAWASYNLIQL